MEKNIIEKKYKIKKFFKIIFNNINPKEFIRIVQMNKENDTIVQYFNDIDNLIDYVTKNCFYYNTFFSLSTTDRQGGKEENLINRTVLAFDFDKKDNPSLSVNEITNKFKKIGLWYHAIVDSGHGFHVYVCIQKTNELDKVAELQKAIAIQVGADLNAIKKTQILRVPCTYNLKDTYKKLVRIIFHFERKTIKPYDINTLYNKFCCNSFIKGDKYININNNMPPCVKRALEEGSYVGKRNLDLYNIIVYYKHKKESLSFIKNICKEWNNKNEKQLNLKELEYQIEYNYTNCNWYRCDNCLEEIKEDCKNYSVSDFNLEEYGEPIINLISKVGKQCKNNKKGTSSMSGNELFIYNVMLNNKDLSLSVQDILKLIEDRKTKKTPLSEKTVRKELKNLEDKAYITMIKGVKKVGKKDAYKITLKKLSNDNIRVSYFANIMVIKGHITPNELRCYIRMRYLHNEALKNGKAKGNIFTVSLDTLAESLGVDKKNVIEMTRNLYENNIIDRRAIQKEDNPKQFYYQYKLNM